MTHDESHTHPHHRVPSPGPSAEDVGAEFLAFCEAEFQPVVKYLMFHGAGFEDAKDAAQEAFLGAWRQMSSASQVRSRRKWIRKVALNKLHRPYGSNKKRPVVEPNSTVPDRPHPGPCDAELRVQMLDVMEALSSLEEQDRAMVALHIDGFSAIEAAELLHLSFTPQQARDALKRARRRLAHRLNGRHEGGTV